MSGWNEVNDASPCAFCGKSHWCSVSDDGAAAICHRVNTGAGEHRTDRNGTEFWLYRLGAPTAVPSPLPEGLADAERAPAEDLDRVYRRLISDLRLTQRHRDDLKRRCLDDASIDTGNYRTLASSGRRAVVRRLVETFGEALCLKVPGLFRTNEQSGGEIRLGGACGLLIPVRDADNRVVALKVRRDDDGGGPRYTYVSSKRHRGPGPGAQVHVPAIPHSASASARATEGEIKADVTTFISKMLTLGFPGAAHWRAAISIFKRLDIRTVHLAFDADSRTNPHVARNLSEAKFGFIDAGFEVFEETWPAEWGKGIDDVFASGHAPTVVRVSPDSGADAAAKSAHGAGDDESATHADPEQPPEVPGAAAGGFACDRIFTDITIAQVFIDTHGEDVRFVESLGKWFIWNGKRWKIDDTGATLAMVAVVARSLTLAIGLQVPPAVKNALFRQEQKPRLAGALAIAGAHPGIALRVDDLDSNPWLLCCRNGTVDLRTGKLLPHRRGDYITRRVPHDYDPTAKCTRWLAFLNEVTNNREELVQFIRRFVGYCVTAEVSEHALLLLVGSGCNGKSVLVETLMYVFGSDLATPAPPGLLLVQKGERHATEILDLRSRRLVVASEVPKSGAFSEERVKWLTGGDALKGRGMRQDFVTFTPSHKFMICANHMPRVNDASDGFWRRVRVVPFDVSFKGREDRGLAAALRAEASAILAWAGAGCIEWQKNGLGEPVAVTAATRAYRSDEDVIGRFLAERTAAGVDDVDVALKEIFTAFKAWCDANGEAVSGGSKALGRELAARGWTKRHTKNGNVWTAPQSPSPEPPDGADPTRASSGDRDAADGAAPSDTHAPPNEPTNDTSAAPDADQGEGVNHGEPSGRLTSMCARTRARTWGGTSLRVHDHSPFTGTLGEGGPSCPNGDADAVDIDDASPATIDGAREGDVDESPRRAPSQRREARPGRWDPCPADTDDMAHSGDDALFGGGAS